MKLPKFRIDDSYVEYGMAFMQEVYDEIGFRTCGTEGEHQSTQKIKGEYEKLCDEVQVEEFEVANQAYPAGMIRPIGWFFLISNILYYIIPSLTWIVLIPMVLWILELFGLKKAIDWAYPKQKSYNVYGKIKPKKETKTIILFSGHQDSPYIFPITAKYRHKGQMVIFGVFGLALIFILMGIIRGIISLIPSNPFLFPQTSPNGGWIWVDYVALIGWVNLIPVMYISQTFVSHKKSFGANDNFSGTVAALALAKYFQKHRPDHVELWFIAFGSEEAGERGSFNFAQTHKDELNEKDAYLINFECVGGGDLLMFVTREMMCIPHRDHSKEVYTLLHESSLQTSTENDCRRSEMLQGYTDAEAFSRAGIKASSMIGLNFDGYPMIWHNEKDNPDIIKKDFLGDAMSVGVKAVEIRDLSFSAVKPKKEQNKGSEKTHPKIPRIEESDYDLLP